MVINMIFVYWTSFISLNLISLNYIGLSDIGLNHISLDDISLDDISLDDIRLDDISLISTLALLHWSVVHWSDNNWPNFIDLPFSGDLPTGRQHALCPLFLEASKTVLFLLGFMTKASQGKQ